MGEIQEAVITIAAKTVAGLQVRAAVMKRIFRDADEEYTDARLVRAMIRDIEAMSSPRAPVA